MALLTVARYGTTVFTAGVQRSCGFEVRSRSVAMLVTSGRFIGAATARHAVEGGLPEQRLPQLGVGGELDGRIPHLEPGLVGWIEDAAVAVSAVNPTLEDPGIKASVYLVAKDDATANEKLATVKAALGRVRRRTKDVSDFAIAPEMSLYGDADDDD